VFDDVRIKIKVYLMITAGGVARGGGASAGLGGASTHFIHPFKTCFKQKFRPEYA